MKTLGLSIGSVSLALVTSSCSSPVASTVDNGAGATSTGMPVTSGAGMGSSTGTTGTTTGGGAAATGGGTGPATGAPTGVAGGGTATGAGGTGSPTGTVTGGAGMNAGAGAGNTGGVSAGGTNGGAGVANTAGMGSGGATTGSSEPTIRPTLITSGQGAYWTIGEVTPGGTTATFTVNSAQEYQDWHGWGGTFNEKGWTALASLDQPGRDNVMNLLFSVEDGLGLDYGRIPIGPSDYANERYTLSDAPGSFSIDHDVQTLIPYIKAAQAVKGDVIYWGSPWTPPPWAKMGNTQNGGYDKGLFDPQFYTQYADFFVSWIQAYEAQGIPIDFVMPQNEPGWAQAYPTCAWGPATDSENSAGNIPDTEPVTLGTFVDSALFPAIDAAGLTTDVWFGTLSNNGKFSFYWQDMAAKPTWSRVVGIGLQWETQMSMSTAVGSGKIVMQSEHKCGNYPWLGSQASSAADANRDNFLSSMAPNNHAYGEESWDLIKSWIEDGVHIYSAWNMVLDHEGFNLDESRPWPQNALIAINMGTGDVNVTAYYYVFRHVAQYVAVGAKRIGVDGNALAFKNPDGSIVTIMFNEGSQASMATLSVDGTMVQFSIPARGWATVNTPAAG